MTGFYTSGGRETCTNGNSICQPVGAIGDSSTIGICMDTAQSCIATGSPVDAVCRAGAFGCTSSGQCAVPSYASCVTGTDQAGNTTYAALGTACGVDMELDGSIDANEVGICTPTDGSETVCMASCSSNSCVAVDSGNSNHAYCQAIESPGTGALEQYNTTGSVNGARDDYAVCVTSDASCSSDSNCKADRFVGCDTVQHVCLPPSLTACSSNGVPGTADQGTSCDSDGDGSSDGICVFTVDSNTDGMMDVASVCLPSYGTAQGGWDDAVCTTDGAECRDISGDGGAYVCTGSGD